MNRRGLLGMVLTSPFVVRSGILMPTHSITPVADRVERIWSSGGMLDGEHLLLERAIVLRNGTGSIFSNCRFEGDATNEPLVTLGYDTSESTLITRCQFMDNSPVHADGACIMKWLGAGQSGCG